MILSALGGAPFAIAFDISSKIKPGILLYKKKHTHPFL